MSKRRTQSHSSALQCPLCEAQINVAAGRGSQKVQCPQCRQVVELGPPAEEEEVRTAPSADPEPVAAIPGDDERIAALEKRVANLERVISQLSPPPAVPEQFYKVKWIAGEALPDYSAEQADVLGYNLRGIPSGTISIQFASGDHTARSRAEWFREVFARAQWRVHGPEDARPEQLGASGVALVTSLPVSPEAAATYLALRAAGFPIVTTYDHSLGAKGERLVVA